SHFPVYAVTPPSPLTATHESSRLLPAPSRRWASAVPGAINPVVNPAMLKPTIKAPDLAMNCLRERDSGFLERGECVRREFLRDVQRFHAFTSCPYRLMARIIRPWP